MKTFRSEVIDKERGKQKRRPGEVVNRSVLCPVCNRKVAADMLVDVSALPREVTHGAAYACDACLDRWDREDKVTPADVAKSHGANAATVKALQEYRERHHAARKSPGRLAAHLAAVARGEGRRNLSSAAVAGRRSSNEADS